MKHSTSGKQQIISILKEHEALRGSGPIDVRGAL